MNRNRTIFLAGAAVLCLELAMPFAAKAEADAVAAQSVQVKKADGSQVTGADGKPATATVTSTIPSSSSNYLDDKLFWTDNITLKANPSDADPSYCIPAGTTLIGHDSALKTVTPNTPAPASGASAPASADQYLPVLLGNGYFFGLIKTSDAVSKANGNLPVPPNHADICPSVTTPKQLNDGQIAYVAKSDLDVVDYRAGWDFGALAVPFKYQLSGKKSLSGSATLGGYLGYRFPLLAIVLRPVIFAGASVIPTSATTGGTTTSQSSAGFSYGFGLLTTVKNSLQVGVVLGFDHVDSAQPYPYNDKPWVSLEIGYSFAT